MIVACPVPLVFVSVPDTRGFPPHLQVTVPAMFGDDPVREVLTTVKEEELFV